MNTQISRFLFAYRNTPNTVTGVSPAEMLFKRRPKTRLDQVKPEMYKSLARAADRMIKSHPKQNRHFEVGERVLARSYRGGEQWLSGTVVEKTGPVSYKIEIGGGWVKRHVDQIQRDMRKTMNTTVQVDDVPRVEPDGLTMTEQTNVVNPNAAIPEDTVQSAQNGDRDVNADNVPENADNIPEASDAQEHSLETRRSVRDRRPPKYLEGYEQC